MWTTRRHVLVEPNVNVKHMKILFNLACFFSVRYKHYFDNTNQIKQLLQILQTRHYLDFLSKRIKTKCMIFHNNKDLYTIPVTDRYN